MENDFGILISKVWANFDNPIRAMIFQNVLNFLYAALSGGTVLIYVISPHYICVMELCTIFTILLFMKMCFPSTLILRFVRAKMNVLAFMTLVNWTSDIQENLTIVKLYVQSQ